MTFGEFGGGVEIAVRALQTVNYAWIKRNPPTMLTKILLEDTGAKNELELMEGLSNDHFPSRFSSHLILCLKCSAPQKKARQPLMISSAGRARNWGG